MRKHALVIDDSAAILRKLQWILQELGFTTSQAVNGREGLDRLKECAKVDLVLVDWEMPEMDGHEFVTHARQMTKCKDVPLVMVTVRTEMERVSMALEAGADEYIMKPFTKEIIASKLKLLGVEVPDEEVCEMGAACA